MVIFDEVKKVPSNVRVLYIQNATTEKEILNQYYKQLSYPYDSLNWDAFNDVIQELEWWVDEHEIWIVHPQLPLLPDKDLKIYFEIIGDVSSSWDEFNELRLVKFFFSPTDKGKIEAILPDFEIKAQPKVVSETDQIEITAICELRKRCRQNEFFYYQCKKMGESEYLILSNTENKIGVQLMPRFDVFITFDVLANGWASHLLKNNCKLSLLDVLWPNNTAIQKECRSLEQMKKNLQETLPLIGLFTSLKIKTNYTQEAWQHKKERLNSYRFFSLVRKNEPHRGCIYPEHNQSAKSWEIRYWDGEKEATLCVWKWKYAAFRHYYAMLSNYDFIVSTLREQGSSNQSSC